jgi:hypothetical protein
VTHRADPTTQKKIEYPPCLPERHRENHRRMVRVFNGILLVAGQTRTCKYLLVGEIINASKGLSTYD